MKSGGLEIITILNESCLEKSIIKKENLVEVLVPVYRKGRVYYRKQWIRKTTPNNISDDNKGNSKVSDYKYDKNKANTNNNSSTSGNKTQQPIKHVIKTDAHMRFSYAVFLKLKHDRPKAYGYLRKCGISWVSSTNPGTNWLRACISAHNHSRED